MPQGHAKLYDEKAFVYSSTGKTSPIVAELRANDELTLGPVVEEQQLGTSEKWIAVTLPDGRVGYVPGDTGVTMIREAVTARTPTHSLLRLLGGSLLFLIGGALFLVGAALVFVVTALLFMFLINRGGNFDDAPDSVIALAVSLAAIATSGVIYLNYRISKRPQPPLWFYLVTGAVPGGLLQMGWLTMAIGLLRMNRKQQP